MLLFWTAFMMLVVGSIFFRDGWRMSLVLFVLSALLLTAGFIMRRRAAEKQHG